MFCNHIQMFNQFKLVPTRTFIIFVSVKFLVNDTPQNNSMDVLRSMNSPINKDQATGMKYGIVFAMA